MNALPDLIASHPFWAWMALGAIFLAVEVTTGSGWLLWPAGSAALVGVVLLLWPLSAPVAIAVFAVATIISTYVGRRFIRNVHPGASDVNNPLSRLVGHFGEAATAFEGGGGRVFVDGKEWSAELEEPGALPAGAKVEVVAVVGGARLRVRAG
jgi:membrane protein implicated in regulation of membrane protease activity